MPGAPRVAVNITRLHRRQVEPGERERFRQVVESFGVAGNFARVDLQHHAATESSYRKEFQQLSTWLIASTWYEVLILGRTRPVGHVDVPQPRAELVDHPDGVTAGGRRVRQIDGDIVVVVVDRIPTRDVGLQLSPGSTPWIHVLDGEGDAGLTFEP